MASPILNLVLSLAPLLFVMAGALSIWSLADSFKAHNPKKGTAPQHAHLFLPQAHGGRLSSAGSGFGMRQRKAYFSTGGSAFAALSALRLLARRLANKDTLKPMEIA
jgi:hypothetical protein